MSSRSLDFISELCRSIGARSLECKGFSGLEIQNIALADVLRMSILLREAVSEEIRQRPEIPLLEKRGEIL